MNRDELRAFHEKHIKRSRNYIDRHAEDLAYYLKRCIDDGEPPEGKMIADYASAIGMEREAIRRHEEVIEALDELDEG